MLDDDEDEKIPTSPTPLSTLDAPVPPTSLLSQPSIYLFLGLAFLVIPATILVWLRSERYGALRAKTELYRFFGREIRKSGQTSGKYQKVEGGGGP